MNTLIKSCQTKMTRAFRLRPDGERFVFTVIVDQGFRPDWVDAMQLIQRNWQEVGIDARLDVVEGEVATLRNQDPARDATVWAGENGTGQLPMLCCCGKTWWWLYPGRMQRAGGLGTIYN